MKVVEFTETGEIQAVSVIWNDPVDRGGYRFHCSHCGFYSPIMKYLEGARRHRVEHSCDA